MNERLMKLNPFLLFLPFLFLFILFVLKFSTNEMIFDERSYFQFAKNLTHGFYSPPPPDISLWYGPGYPLFLIPFVYFNSPLIILKLFNAFFFYSSVVFLFLTLKRYVSPSNSLIIASFWALYFPAWQTMPYILTEIFSIFLCTIFIFTLVLSIKDNKKNSNVISGLFLGILVLTKVIFGYVLLFMFVIAAFSMLIKKTASLKKFTTICTIALIINLPYLFYTYSLTNKLFYWGNSGGSVLYWMSTPFEGEYGDWNNNRFTANCEVDSNFSCDTASLVMHHKKEIDSVLALPVIDQDAALKKIALNNIKTHPVKYLKNCFSNISRMFFGVPISYLYQKDKTITRFPFGSILFVLILFSAHVVSCLFFLHFQL